MSRNDVSGLGGIASPAMAAWQQLTFCELEAFGEPRAWEESPRSLFIVSPHPLIQMRLLLSFHHGPGSWMKHTGVVFKH